MTANARSCVWWPYIDKDIEATVKSCEACQQSRTLAPGNFSPNERPKTAMDRVHIDFADFQNRQWLIIVDAKTNWPEVVQMRNTTSEQTVQALHEIFSRLGLPKEIHSDNGPQLTSRVFNNYMSKNNIVHRLSPPYHPQSNGLAERFVGTFKRRMKTLFEDGKTLGDALPEFLAA
jgi:transposase InsO family protein